MNGIIPVGLVPWAVLPKQTAFAVCGSGVGLLVDAAPMFFCGGPRDRDLRRGNPQPSSDRSKNAASEERNAFWEVFRLNPPQRHPRLGNKICNSL